MAVPTARRHASSETTKQAALRFLELVDQNPGIRRGVLAERAGAPRGLSAAAVLKAARGLDLPQDEKRGAYGHPVPEILREVAALLYMALVAVHPHKPREELAWEVASRLRREYSTVTGDTVRRWVKDNLGVGMPKCVRLVGGDQ